MPDDGFRHRYPPASENVVYGGGVLLLMTEANLLMRYARVCDPMNPNASI